MAADATISNGNFLWQGLVVGQTVLTFIVGIAALARRPPLAEELARTYFTKEEARGIFGNIDRHETADRVSRAALYEKIDAVEKRSDARIDQLRTELNDSLRIVEKEIGRLQGAQASAKGKPA